ncbi:MAG: glucose-6-phosphate isomerase [Burkholderiales bacterium]|nr:glucose-6-phosphate isomerase [Burkholderiales bacterium]
MPAGQNKKSSASLTRTPAWRALAEHRRTWRDRHLRGLFAADPQRFSRFSAEACGLLLDYSKNLVTAETLELLLALARERGLEDRISDLLAGKRVNNTEKRAAWHSALRAGHAAPREVRGTLESMRSFTGALRAGAVKGAGGRPVTDVVSLGIGGSALGPALAAEACAAEGGPRVHFVTTPGEMLARTLAPLDAETTLFIVQSKSFSTQETLINARAARAWLENSRGGADPGAHFAAVTAQAEAALSFGVPQDRVFPMWDWVGGRYSLWSAVGLPAMIAMGGDRFDDMLAGAAAMDAHFAETPPERNLPVLMALGGLWHAHFFGMDSRAVIPYAPGLELLPAWLQQLEMESLGKSVSRNGKPLRHDSGAVLWGGAGTEGQHAYFQMLHQGTRPVPVDFIACRAPRAGTDGETHAVMLANCFAQSALLMQGVSATETEQDLLRQGIPAREAARLAPHQALPGNRPSNTLLLDALSPRSLGALLALYEHRTFVQSAIWDINAFDQWGVEHGKRLANSLLPEFSSAAPATAHDTSTNGLVNYVKKMKTEKP